ncbi:hypothetical protein N7456_008017 [Penicillium angulare]|uniref:BOD1/SHG1 domain-containing protein n=1 Tax=Penicillium angulare TaxID=116970 RepID=A0A9W9FBP8_9EURO|nr:hypothetical protein N7456_008017 [Penicillium angulare]
MATSEAMEDVQSGSKRPSLDIETLKSKRFKAEDLPLSAAQHSAIDKLLHSFKKKGGFDSIRKKIWAEFNDGESKTKFTDELIALAESEIEREPAHLSRERGKAATLIEGAVDRSDVYKNAELSIDRLASIHLGSILDSVRDIRRHEIGDEAAAKEEEAGNKTDSEYEACVTAKRDEREKVWREEMRKQKEIDDEQKRIKDEERRKRREIERKKDDEDRARRKEVDDQRRAERERLRDEQRAIDEQRDRERDERYERRRREDRDRYRERDRSRTRDFRDRSPAYRSDRGLSPRSRDSKRDRPAISKDPTPAPGPVDEKSLEEAALQMLLKEGEELAAKARQKPEFDFEQAEALENGLKPPASTSGHAKDVVIRYQTERNVLEMPLEIEVKVAAALADARHLAIALNAIGNVLEIPQSDLAIAIVTVIATWMHAVGTVISEMNAAIDLLHLAVAVDQQAGTATETETDLGYDPDLAIEMIAVAQIVAQTGAGIWIAKGTGSGMTVTVTVLNADHPRDDDLGLDLGLLQREEGHDPVVLHPVPDDPRPLLLT